MLELTSCFYTINLRKRCYDEDGKVKKKHKELLFL